MTYALPETDSCINYIEFAVTDITRAKDFYGKAFGWTFTDFGPDYCEFTDGQLKGGFAFSENVSFGGALIVLYGTDLDILLEKVKDAGGKVVRPTFGFPGGKRFQFTDPEGHELAVWTHL